jgi:ParB-like chromosome segregation protein Spo0J
MYEELAKVKRHAKPAALESRKRVPITDLFVAEQVFQWRRPHSDLQAEERHMGELMRALEQGRELEPILVMTIGDKLYVVDGHHRVAAYAALKRKTVPVVHFNGGLEDAWLKSLDANIRDKLPITREDKYEAAYTLVKHKVRRDLNMTWEEIARRATVSERLIYRMQRELKKALEEYEYAKSALAKNDDDTELPEDPYRLSWKESLRTQRDKAGEYEPGEEFRNEHARKMADQIMSKVRMNLTANPDITAMALRMISEQLPRALIEEWEQEAIDVLIQQARDADSEDAEQALKRARELLNDAREHF